MKLQRAELKLGWKYSAIAFIIVAASVSPEIYRLSSSHPHHSNYVAGIEHGTDDTGKNPPPGNT